MPFYKDIQQYIEDKEKRDALFNVFKKVTYESYKRGQLVFREHDSPCTKAYVIIKGRVGVIREDPKPFLKFSQESLKPVDLTKSEMILSPRSPISPNKHNSISAGIRKTIVNQLGFGSILNLHRSPNVVEPPNLSATKSAPPKEIIVVNNELYEDVEFEVKKIISTYGNLIAKMGYGQIFGQVALQNNKPRNASVIAIDDLHLMVIHKTEFEVIKVYYSCEFNERKQFLSTILPQLESVQEIKVMTKFLQGYK